MKKISTFINQQLPQYVRENYHNIEIFLKAYHDWMEKEGYEHLDILSENDIDRTTDIYLDLFWEEFLYAMPKNILISKKLLLKHSKEFFQSKGSELSFKFLFRILYNDEVEFYYPETDTKFFATDSWITEQYIIIEPVILLSDLNKLVGNIFTSRDKSSIVGTEEIILTTTNGTPIYELKVSRSIGNFIQGDYLYYDNNPVALIKSLGVLKKPGYWRTTKGHLSSTNKFFDNYYYQQFSYVLKSGTPLSKYKDTIQKLIHPAGTKMFSQFNTSINFPETYIPIESSFTQTKSSGVIIPISSNILYDIQNVRLSQVAGWKESDFLSQKGIVTPVDANWVLGGVNTGLQGPSNWATKTSNGGTSLLKDTASLIPDQSHVIQNITSQDSALLSTKVNGLQSQFYISV